MPTVKKQRKFLKSDWDAAAHFIAEEKERRAQDPRRKAAERQWAEVDRQVAMIPKGIHRPAGQNQDPADAWLPDVELPLQASALEVIAADARRLKFPESSDWYRPHSDVTEALEARLNPTLAGEPEQRDQSIDQETADILVRAVMDHYHHMFKFRNQIEFLDAEAIKYGTYACRISKILLPQFGPGKSNVFGPAVIPISIKDLYLDDSPQQVMQEGIAIAPAPIRAYLQKLSDAQHAAKTGGASRGWIEKNLKGLEPFGEGEKKDHIELLEWGGDLVFPRKTTENILLPNVTVTVAVGNNGPRVVRFRENPTTFRQYVFGTYMNEGNSLYGTSPLMKGQPIQEAATEILNRLIAVGILSAEPPISWDPDDSRLTGTGGPAIFPSAQWPYGGVDPIQVHKIGDLAELLQTYIALLQQYEDLTGVNAPRRGAQAKSHTTAFAAGIESEKGLIRTADFVRSQELGPITDILGLEYRIARETIKGTVFVKELNRFVKIEKADLPENVVFEILGSAGPASVQEQNQNMVVAFQLAAQLSGPSIQLGGETLNFGAAMKEILKNAGISNPERFVTQAPTPPPQVQGGQGAAGTPPGVPGQ